MEDMACGAQSCSHESPSSSSQEAKGDVGTTDTRPAAASQEAIANASSEGEGHPQWWSFQTSPEHEGSAVASIKFLDGEATSAAFQESKDIAGGEIHADAAAAETATKEIPIEEKQWW